MKPGHLSCGHNQEVTDDTNVGDEVFCVQCLAKRIYTFQPELVMGTVAQNGAAPQRSYGCSYGCGNPYDYIFVSVADGTTEFLCLPCFVMLAGELVEAMTNPEAADVQEKLRLAGTVEQAPMRSAGSKGRGKNAPVNSEDPDLLTAFDTRITADELPEEFK